MPDLIYTRRRDAQPLSFDEVAQLAPAAFNAMPHPETSDRYRPVSTLDAMDVLADHGFRPMQAAQKKTRKASASRYAEHLIAFAQDRAGDGETRPEIILYNSHDASSSLKLFGGAFRFICSNDIVAGDGFEAKARHVGSSVEGVDAMLRDIVKGLPDMLDRIGHLQRTEIDHEQALEFAYNAAALRWEMMPSQEEIALSDERLRGSYAERKTIRDLVRAYRREDAEPNAWAVFNRVQEGLIRGRSAGQVPINVASFTDKSPHGSRRKARPVGSVSESVRINRSLWDMAGDLIDA
jgi:hypothetical protein